MIKRYIKIMTINGQAHELEIKTEKAHGKGIECRAKVTCDNSFITLMFGDGGDYERVLAKNDSRATENNIRLLHTEGMQYLDKVNAEIEAHYADTKNTHIFEVERGYVYA